MIDRVTLRERVERVGHLKAVRRSIGALASRLATRPHAVLVLLCRRLQIPKLLPGVDGAASSLARIRWLLADAMPGGTSALRLLSANKVNCGFCYLARDTLDKY